MFLLNNKEFILSDILKKREGAEKDEENLQRVFEQLGFSIQLCIDKTEPETKSAISKFKNWIMCEQETCDMIVIAIMSHGEQGDNFFLTDGKKISIEYILKYKLNMQYS